MSLIVEVKGSGKETLEDSHFLANGGEATIYAKGKTAFKIYHDPSKFPFSKIYELSVLDNPFIMKPEKIILDHTTHKEIGYTMKYVKGAYALAQLFPRSFRKQNNLGTPEIAKLADKFRDLIKFVHSHDILVVDLNELNFLADIAKWNIYAIDVNSYQTRNFPADVIMPSVMDRRAKFDNRNNRFLFDEGTDWFSWGIVSIQMFIGIHPYRGGHKDYDGTLAEKMSARMRDNVSIFHKGATVPPACDSFNLIPPSLRQWYYETFEHGMRQAPPLDFYAKPILVSPAFVYTAKTTVVPGSLFDLKEIAAYNSEILDFVSYFGNSITYLKDSTLCNKLSVGIPSGIGEHRLIFTPKLNKPICAWLDGDRLKLWNVESKQMIPTEIQATGMMESNGRLYLLNARDIMEVQFLEFSGIGSTISKVGNALNVPQATKLFPGCILQNLLGRWHVSYFPQKGYCMQKSLSELDGYKLIDAKFIKNVLVVVGTKKNGEYDRFVFRFSGDDQDARKTENINNLEINFAVSDTEKVLLFSDTHEIEVFSSKSGSVVNRMTDTAIDDSMKLFSEGGGFLLSKGDKLFSFKTKPANR